MSPGHDRGRPGGSGLNVDAAASSTNALTVPAESADSALIDVVRDSFGCPVGLTVADGDAPPARERAVEGARRRDVGHRRVAQAHGGEPWLGLAQAWIEAAAGRGQVLTAEDVRAAVGEPPNANLLGVVLRRCRLKGTIRVVGVTYASRPEAHHRLLQQWGAR